VGLFKVHPRTARSEGYSAAEPISEGSAQAPKSHCPSEPLETHHGGSVSNEQGGSMPQTQKAKGLGKTAKVMHEFKHGSLKFGSGRRVRIRKQAVAIALSEARKSGAKIPKKKSSR
jgi:hypothetical protein